MAQNAVAQQLLHDLRRKIAAIEGSLPDRLDDAPASRPSGRTTLAAGDAPPRTAAAADGPVILRTNGLPAALQGRSPPPQATDRAAVQSGVIASRATAFDRALGGGLERAALCEIHGLEARDAGAVSGFALALASLARRQGGSPGQALPLLWIGAGDLIAETGLPYMPGITGLFGIPHQALLLARVRRPLDALWIAGEAAGLPALAAVMVEVRGNPRQLDLTATRRLHRRARAAGRPVFLLRLSAAKEPTAAPVRLCVSAAPACPREIFGQALSRSLGAPAFMVEIDKCRANPGRNFILEWKDNEHGFRQRLPKNPVAMVPLSSHRQDHAPALWPVLAGGSGRRREAG